MTRETDDACSVVFDVPGEARAKFRYKPGQFLTLQLPGPDGPVGRCYSLCSSPHADDAMRIAVKRVNGRHRLELDQRQRCKPGMRCRACRPPACSRRRTLDEDLLLFAGGSGITPVLSILKSALAEGTGQVVLVYANQHEESVIFAAQLRELAAQHPERLHVIHWLESVQGLPSHAQLTALAAPYTSYTAFVCGPSPFMESVTHCCANCTSRRRGSTSSGSNRSTKNPFEAVEVEAPVEGGATAALEVNLDGQTTTRSTGRCRPSCSTSC